jgi:hypothetical protein
MKWRTICAFVIVALLAFASSLLWRWSPEAQPSTVSAGMGAMMEFQAKVGARKLANQDVEDMSLLYPSPPKR